MSAGVPSHFHAAVGDPISMQTSILSVLQVLAGAAIMAGGSAALAQPLIAPPSNFGYYCSSNHGGLGVTAAGENPCGSWTDSQIAHAGLWDTTGVNSVYVRCDGGANGVFLSSTPGSTAIWEAYKTMQKEGRTNCRYNVVPASLPIFRYPWLKSTQAAMSGSTPTPFDFAYQRTYTPAQVCQSGVGAWTFVDHKGHGFTSIPDLADHKGWDWTVPKSAPGDWGVRAVAAGRVILARTMGRSMSCPGQKEVYIRHIVARSQASRFREEFISYYAHLNDLNVETGQDVVSNQLLGGAGHSGSPACAGATTHLHFGTYRVRNTNTGWQDYAPFTAAGNLAAAFDFTFTGNHERNAVDPFGWNMAGCSDPNALWAPPGEGAPSINLWRKPARIPGTSQWETFAPPDADHTGH